MVDEKDKDKKKLYKELLELFNGESVQDSIGILSGFNNEIRNALARENMEKDYSEVKLNLLD